jgi:hypothetical protein
MRMSQNAGSVLYEKILYANKDEQEYFNKKKIYTKPELENSKYKR